MRKTNKFNYRVAGKKLLSRFGMSHKDSRALNKIESEYFKGYPTGPKLRFTTKRLKKKCNHNGWVDTSYGGPDGGEMFGYCKHCGYSTRVVLY